MCGTCGCGSKAETRILNLQTGEETALSDEDKKDLIEFLKTF